MKAKIRYADTFMDTTPRRIEECDARQLEVLKIFSRYKFNRILDVGCADGNFSILLKEACNAKEVYGIEIAEKGVKLARNNGVKAFQLDIDDRDFPFEDNYFDAIFAGEIIEHLYNPDHFLEECYRVLHSEGIFVLTTRNLASLYNRIALLLGFQPFPTSVSLRFNVGRPFEVSDEILGDHIRVFTYRAILQLLSFYNFKIVEVKGAPSVLPKNKKWYFIVIRLIDKILSRIPPLSQGIIIISRKHVGDVK